MTLLAGDRASIGCLRCHSTTGTPWSLGDTGRVRRHHRWDDEDDRPEPDLTDPATAAAFARAARDVRRVRLIHLALLAVGLFLLAIALLLHAS